MTCLRAYIKIWKVRLLSLLLLTTAVVVGSSRRCFFIWRWCCVGRRRRRVASCNTQKETPQAAATGSAKREIIFSVFCKHRSPKAQRRAKRRLLSARHKHTLPTEWVRECGFVYGIWRKDKSIVDWWSQHAPLNPLWTRTMDPCVCERESWKVVCTCGEFTLWIICLFGNKSLHGQRAVFVEVCLSI
jgi:hypothetical protein